MDFKQEKINRNRYLLEVYKEVKGYSPTSPTSAIIGLSKDRLYNPQTKEWIDNDAKRGGYLIGERIGLGEVEVDSIVNACIELKYLRLYGPTSFCFTREGISYLEKLEEQSLTPIQMNIINTGDINAPLQLQQNTQYSQQEQTTTFAQENIKSFFDALKADIVDFESNRKKDFETEISYAEIQLQKGKDVKNQLSNIGELMREIGLGVFTNVVASPIYEIIKPFLSL